MNEKSGKPIKILLIEDNPGDSRLIKEMLKEVKGNTFDVEQAESLKDAFVCIEEKYYDVVLSDLGLPDSWGLDTFVRLHDKFPNIPIIVLTGLNDETTGIEAVRYGAQDYLNKGQVETDLLSKAIKYAIERKKVEEDLMMEKSFSDSVINSLPGIFYLFDNKGQLLRWNKNAEKISGYSNEEIDNMNILDFFNGENKTVMAQELQEVFSNGEANAEANLTSKGGKEIPHFFTGLRTMISDRLYLVGMGMDITEIKRMENALRESEEKYRNLVERANDGIIILQEGHFKFVNKKMADMLGYEISDLIDKDFLKHVSPKEREPVRVAYERRLAGEEVPNQFELELVRRDGKILSIDVNLGTIERDGRPADLIFLRDITEKKEAEKELLMYRQSLEERTAMLEKLIEESPVATISTDLDGNISTMNKSAKKLLEMTEYENVIIKSILGDGIDLENTDNFSLDYSKRDGSKIPLDVSTAILRDGEEKKGLIVTLKDISEISGLMIKPVEEERMETEMVYELDQGEIYLLNDDSPDTGFEIFVDHVKHGMPGLCISRMNPEKIKKRYQLEKTPIVWLTRKEVEGENCIHPNDLITKLQSTLNNFISEAEDGVILLDGLEYLVTQNDFEMVLKFIQAINDDLMVSSSRLITPIDSEALDPRDFHSLKKEMIEFKEKKINIPVQ